MRRVVEQEIAKLLNAGFIIEIKYITWLANVVLVKKGECKMAHVH